MTAAYDVVVVGGGPVGAACARELALAGRRVLLLDPEGEQGQGWKAAAGMLAPQMEAEPGRRRGLYAHRPPRADASTAGMRGAGGAWGNVILSEAKEA